ncbi:hypothetical protein GCM10007304_12500 [Rhodococcoides trifolii]|uniref:DUF559 domain-containing protein n=1 Tax=Rhodococcoides trifolii TaxID=908250 RepID=A0A917CX93_9NOCA|nr:type IV toxin-antitoxin system AbiEi family antitoxin domain-containing protein [Rhodococcus trifolii]GGG00076.1 hypothetical protein GCM10007304_12500 [Rhodococcus trifolii]
MPEIIRRADAIARGVTDSELRSYCRTGTYRQLIRGVYVERAEFDALTPSAQHRLTARAVLASDAAVLSHVTAAVVHGIDVWNIPLDYVHVTRNRSTGGRLEGARHVHSSPYSDDETVVKDGLRITSVARTIADIARTVPFEEAVCAADCAARRFGLTREHIEECLDRRPTHPGNRRARRVAAFMDRRSESVGESRSRVMLADFEPSLQDEFPCEGRMVRVDFLIKKRVVGGFDGRMKYQGKDADDVLWAEKRRENALRGLGLEVVRWTWADLYTPDVVIERIRRALARTTPPTPEYRPPTGSTRRPPRRP